MWQFRKCMNHRFHGGVVNIKVSDLISLDWCNISSAHNMNKCPSTSVVTSRINMDSHSDMIVAGTHLFLVHYTGI